MTPGTVIHLVKTITTRSGGCIASYKLNKDASISVLVLKQLPTPEQLAQIEKILNGHH